MCGDKKILLNKALNQCTETNWQIGSIIKNDLADWLNYKKRPGRLAQL